MILPIINRIIKNRIKKISFPKLPIKKYNYLWEVTQNKFKRLSILEVLTIIKCLLFQFGTVSLLAIPSIFWVFKNSMIIEDKDTKDHLKMFKALEVDKNNVEQFIKYSLIINLFLRIIKTLSWLFWLPIKIALIFYFLDYFNYDISYFYYKLNNLSLGMLDWYYKTLVDFLESFIIKNDIYKLNNHANIK